MVCKAFSFHERFHPAKTVFICGIATIENAFRAVHKMEKDMQIQAIPQGSSSELISRQFHDRDEFVEMPQSDARSTGSI